MDDDKARDEALMRSNGQTWLICGGRDFTDRELFERAMADLLAARGQPAKIVHGGARGADTMGGELGEKLGLPTVAVLADWSIGRKAGPIRNQRMLDEHAPDLVVAFPGGRGTADMVRRARNSGVEVAKIGVQETRGG